MIPRRKCALLEGDSGIFNRGGWSGHEINEGQFKELHAKFGELSVANGPVP